MSYQKQPELNSAYYGPPIPPPQSHRRPGRPSGGGCGCCLLDCLCDCGCCLLGCVFKFIFSIFLFIALILLVFWLIVHPHEPKFYASDASLSTFNFTAKNNNLLSHNLAVNFTIRNPNRKIGIYYDQIEANAFFSDHRFSTVQARTFYQGHKNTTSFGPVVFKGQNVVVLGSDEKRDFDKSSQDGMYEIMVRLHLRVRFKLGLFKTGTFKPKVRCHLTVPLKNGGRSAQKFENTRCHYYF